MHYIPRLSGEFDELLSLARNDVQLANAVTEILENGLPIVTADVGNVSTNPAGDRVLIYHIPEQLIVLLAAARAKKIKAVDTPVRG